MNYICSFYIARCLIYEFEDSCSSEEMYNVCLFWIDFWKVIWWKEWCLVFSFIRIDVIKTWMLVLLNILFHFTIMSNNRAFIKLKINTPQDFNWQWQKSYLQICRDLITFTSWLNYQWLETDKLFYSVLLKRLLINIYGNF